VIDKAKKDQLIAQDANSAELIKPLLRGRDIKRYKADFADLYLINTHNGELVEIKDQNHVDFEKKRIFRNDFWENVRNLEHTTRKNQYRINRVDATKYPAIFAHLQTFENELQKRQDKGEHWTNLRNCVYYQDFEKEKIAYPDIAQNSSFVLCQKGEYLNNTCYFINSNSKYLLSVLNSSLILFYYKMIANQLGESGIRFFSQYVEQIPIPDVSEDLEKVFVELVDKILALKKAGKPTHSLENQIDELVFEAYGLSAAERALVLGG